MPGISGARDLLEEGCALEKHRIRNHHHSSGGMQVRACPTQFHQGKTNQPYIDDISRNAGNSNSIPHPYAVPPNQEEIGRDRKDDGLQSHRNSGGKKAGEGCQRTEFADESHNQDDGQEDGGDEAAQKQKLMSPPRFANVSERGFSPNLGKAQHDADPDQEDRNTDEDRFEDADVSPVYRDFPLPQVGLDFAQQDNFLGQRNGGVGNLLELRRECDYFPPVFFHGCRILRWRLVGQFMPLRNRGAELGTQRRVKLIGHFTDPAGAI